MNFLFVKGVTHQISSIIGLIPSYIKFKNNPEKYSLDEKFSVIQKYINNSLNKVKIKLEVSGQENLPEGNVLFVANHANWVDAFVMMSVVDRPVGMIIAKEANWEKFFLIKGWTSMLNCLYLDRKNNRNAIKTINEACDILKTKSSIGIFPEGVVTRSDELAEFKDGAFRMAVKSQVPIVPIVIKNSKNIYVPSSRWLGKLYSPTVKVEILEPVKDHLNTKLKTKDVSNVVREAMLECMDKVSLAKIS